MIDPLAVRLAVAKAGIRHLAAFWRSLPYWHAEAPPLNAEWMASLTSEGRIPSGEWGKDIREMADCLSPATVADSALHIYGDVAGRITANSQVELVIAGDVQPDGVIECDGIAHVFIGGHLRGELVNRGSLTVTVGGDMTGTIKTGNPSDDIHVLGDCSGMIVPSGQDASLLQLEVEGHISFDLLERIADAGYTLFHAVAHHSDRPPGFYPDAADRQRFASLRSDIRWTVHSQSQS